MTHDEALRRIEERSERIQNAHNSCTHCSGARTREEHWRHIRDCGCDTPGEFPCRRAEPEDPDWCPVHGWTMDLCCGGGGQ